MPELTDLEWQIEFNRLVIKHTLDKPAPVMTAEEERIYFETFAHLRVPDRPRVKSGIESYKSRADLEREWEQDREDEIRERMYR